jgi:hypothetical protein
MRLTNLPVYLIGHSWQLLLIACVAQSGCTTPREMFVTGSCFDGNGAPKSGVIITEIELSAAGFGLLPVPAKNTPKAVANSDQNGKFALTIRSKREWFIQIEDPSFTSAFGRGIGRVSSPKELLDQGNLSLTVTIKNGFVSTEWKKKAGPNGAALDNLDKPPR